MYRKILFMAIIIYSVSKMTVNAVMPHETVVRVEAKVDSSEPREPKELKRVEVEKKLNSEELELFARAVQAEAGGEGLHGMELVACTILNRRDSEKYPATIKGVITQKYQFSSYTDGGMQKHAPTDTAYEAIRNELLERTDQRIIYFRAGRYSSYGIPAFKYGNHYFSYGD